MLRLNSKYVTLLPYMIPPCRFVSKRKKFSVSDDDFEDYTKAAELLENSLVGENFKPPVSALQEAELCERRKHKFSVLLKKNPLESSVLTWKAKRQIAFLLDNDKPLDFDDIANNFPITCHGVRKVFNHKSPSMFYKPTSMERLLMHDTRVTKRWGHILSFLKEVSLRSLEDPETLQSTVLDLLPNNLLWLFTDSKANLLIYANGNHNLPHPKDWEVVVKDHHSPGRFEKYAKLFSDSPEEDIYDKCTQLNLSVNDSIETFQRLKNVTSRNSPPSPYQFSPQLYSYLLNCAHLVNPDTTNKKSISLPNRVKLHDYFHNKN
ncbi:unnamed protein product [Trichobilharzia regenti]|nr:unnamed protein product [Trichobilharzia regenti]